MSQRQSQDSIPGILRVLPPCGLRAACLWPHPGHSSILNGPEALCGLDVGTNKTQSSSRPYQQY